MPLRTNAVMRFDEYRVNDDGIVFHFVCLDPGPGMDNDYLVTMTDAELAAVANTAQLRTALTNKLGRKLRATGIATKLDGFIGQTITV